MRRVLISTKPFIFVLFLVGVTVRSAESLSSAIPLGTSTKRANSKRANHLFKMPFRPWPSGCGRFLSVDDGHDRCLQCLGFQHAEDAFVDDSCACCGRMSTISLRSRLSFMKGLAPSAATRAGLSASRGLPGWLSGRSEGYCKSLSAGHAPSDLLLLTQWTSRPVPGWSRWSVPRGAQHFIRCAICR